MKKTRNTVLCALALCLVLPFFSCKKYNEETLTLEALLCTQDTFSFSEHIQPLIHESCLPCHNTSNHQGGAVLETWDDVTNYTFNGSLLGALKHSPGYAPMPMSAAKWSECKIRAVEIWINQGSPNN